MKLASKSGHVKAEEVVVEEICPRDKTADEGEEPYSHGEIQNGREERQFSLEFPVRRDCARYLAAPPRLVASNFRDCQISISGSFFKSTSDAPTIIFFHGNGEISADFEDIGPKLGRECGVNFLALDYRGYGESTGNPSNSTMISDARILFPKVKKFLETRQISTPLIIMGRSLGSASAIEIALHYENQLAGIVLESAYARVEPLMELLGVPSQIIARIDVTPLTNVVKIRKVHLPLLVIHGEDDSLVPAGHGKELFEASPAVQKKLLLIPGADHNTILLHEQYFTALKEWVLKVDKDDLSRLV